MKFLSKGGGTRVTRGGSTGVFRGVKKSRMKLIPLRRSSGDYAMLLRDRCRAREGEEEEGGREGGGQETLTNERAFHRAGNRRFVLKQIAKTKCIIEIMKLALISWKVSEGNFGDSRGRG